ncbi:unnamed protein product [Wuchereria bancrofti]|uniref:Uncharacterized protein n=2 Tax=Wuchereria bancrofti TaxID=6293 RepID=A0A3P7E2N6_WUCBA|nr:unnamed protein product [Wuchereria bancrofti]
MKIHFKNFIFNIQQHAYHLPCRFLGSYRATEFLYQSEAYRRVYDGGVVEHCRSSYGQACHISALNLTLMVLTSIAICVPSISSIIFRLLCIFISALITIRMVYQMHFVVEKPLPVYSKELICNSSEYTSSATAYWLGFQKVPVIGNYISGLIVALLTIALQAIVIYRQQHKRLISGTSVPPRGLVFPKADPSNWDTSLVDMIKFFFNYGFYKFGLEVLLF